MSLREHLVALQDVDSALDQLRHRMARLAERAEAAAAADALKGLRSVQAAATADRDTAESELAQIEADSADLDRQRARLEAQMKTIISPREAEALQHEIANLAERRSQLDDRGLELLEAIADADARADGAMAAEPAALERLAAADSALAAAEADLRREEDALAPQRSSAAAALDRTMLDRYESMRTHQAGMAVARLQGAQCTGCHLELSRGESDEVRRVPDDQVPECPSCGRLLVP